MGLLDTDDEELEMPSSNSQGFITYLFNTPRWIKFVTASWIFMIVFYLSDRHISSTPTIETSLKNEKHVFKATSSPSSPAVQTTILVTVTHTAEVAVTRTTHVTVLETPTQAPAGGSTQQPPFKFAAPVPAELAAPREEGTVVTYVYSESPEARENLIFFIAHGLHNKADFVFILNGATTAGNLIPNKNNIKVVKRDNSCYDLGSHAEVLTKGKLYKQYAKFILMNASVRGPFIPHWSDSCWSDRLVGRVTDDVKLVGIAINCWPTIHVQSMVWATDLFGLELLLYPPTSSPRHDDWMEKLFEHPQSFTRPAGYHIADPSWVEKGLNQCFSNRQLAVEAEISATGIVFGAGKKVDVMLMKFQTDPDYVAHCGRLGEWDPNAADMRYDGINMHPFETMFFKTNRGISPRVLELQTQWIDASNYTSYDYC